MSLSLALAIIIQAQLPTTQHTPDITQEIQELTKDTPPSDKAKPKDNRPKVTQEEINEIIDSPFQKSRLEKKLGPVRVQRPAAIIMIMKLTRQCAPSIKGRFIVRFKIDRDGSVLSATIRNKEHSNMPEGRCLREAALQAKFPPSPSEMTINYPFIFR